jgi:aminoglycoside 6'-N-acetyltransferase
MSVILRAATIDDSYLLKNWDLDEAVEYSGGDDDSYDWDYELPRNVDWREFLIAEVDAVPIGMIVLIDALREESHYWGQDVPADSWAIDIWIGDQEHRSKGYGALMMQQALQRCFVNHGASLVLIDPLQSNHRAIKFYRRIGFTDVGPRRFENDDCLVMSMTRDIFER